MKGMKKRGIIRGMIASLVFALACHAGGMEMVEPESVVVEPWRVELYANWKQLQEPPVTPYHGPFGSEARAFTMRIGPFMNQHGNELTEAQRTNLRAMGDFIRTARHGVYDPGADPRPRNIEFEAAMLEDWRRMGYNCAYKGHAFTFMVGEYLKERGMLGAIDQVLWGSVNDQRRPEHEYGEVIQFDGKPAWGSRESCGSFFSEINYDMGVETISGLGHHYGHHLLTVGDHRLVSSWEPHHEGGRYSRSLMDYRDPMRTEFRAYLRDIWFGDESPAADTNGDGRTYNSFTGENLSSWDEVEPLPLSLQWIVPVWKDGKQIFSSMPEVDSKIFEKPARYKLLVDFHRYFTFEYFRRINEDATARMHEQGTQGRISCYPIAHALIGQPSANLRFGCGFYWYHRLSPVVNVKDMWPDLPLMNLSYAVSDRLARRYRNPVMGWVWFYYGSAGYGKYDGPHDVDRAMARMVSRQIDGTHHWLYSPRYRGNDRAQRLRIAYWQNFFKTHYAGFLAHAAPIKPEMALIMPDTTGYFYRYFRYPKQDFAWTAEAFQHLQYPYDLLTEEEIELGGTDLNEYKAVYVVGSEWSTPAIRSRLVEFIGNGGTVFANVDSLTLCVSANERIDFLKDHFGVDLVRKHKNVFSPSTQGLDEVLWALPLDKWDCPFKLQGHRIHDPEDPRAWSLLYKRTEPGRQYLHDDEGRIQRHPNGEPVRHPDWRMVRDEDGKPVRNETLWRQMDELMAAMPAEVYGIAQSPLDMREPPVVRYAESLTAAGESTSWGEVVEARAVGAARPIAWWGDKVVGIETDRTVWLGTREGTSIHALFPRVALHRPTEPCNPFPTELPELYEAFRPYSETLGYAARKAGVTRPVTFSREDGGLPMNLELRARRASDGTLMVFAISHDRTGGAYAVTVDAVLMRTFAGATAWDMLNNQVIEENTDGRFVLDVPSWGVAVFMIGQPDRLTPIRAAQAKLMAMDMSVPQYFLDRPHLNEFEHDTPVPPIGE